MHTKTELYSAGLLLLTLLGVGPAEATNVERWKASVALVLIDGEHSGTGWVVDSSPSRCLVLTNRHVAQPDGAPLDSLGVVLRAEPDRIRPARVVAATEKDEPLDLAVLRVEVGDGECPRRLVLLPDTPGTGSEVSVIGHPLTGGAPWTVVRGQVANVTETDLILDVTVASGSSGAPVLDAAGWVVGVLTELVDHTTVGAAQSSGFVQANKSEEVRDTLRGWGLLPDGLFLRSSPLTGDALRIEEALQCLLDWRSPVKEALKKACCPRFWLWSAGHAAQYSSQIGVELKELATGVYAYEVPSSSDTVQAHWIVIVSGAPGFFEWDDPAHWLSLADVQTLVEAAQIHWGSVHDIREYSLMGFEGSLRDQLSQRQNSILVHAARCHGDP